MKVIKCELCGSSDLIKKDGLFECQYCGTKYTLEEARNLFTDAIVSISGDVKTKASDFTIKAGVLEKYNGESTIVDIPDNVKIICKECFKDLIIETVNIPNSVTTIGESAFYGCSSLTSVTIPDSVKTFGEDIFYQCSSLDPQNIKMSAVCDKPIFTKIKSECCPRCAGEIKWGLFSGRCIKCGVKIKKSEDYLYIP